MSFKNKLHIPTWLSRILVFSAGRRYYTVVVALIAFVSTATFTFPFVLVLIPAVLMKPGRWLLLGLMCAVASGIGAAVLVAVGIGKTVKYVFLAWATYRYPARFLE